MKAHYMDYPSSPKGFEKWRKQTHALMEEADARLSRSKA
jgi:hypothetical protein